VPNNYENPTIQFEHAMLSDMAYHNVKEVEGGGYALFDDKGNSVKNDYLDKNFEIFNYEEESLDGYYGIIFKRKGADEYIVASRGTKEKISEGRGSGLVFCLSSNIL